VLNVGRVLRTGLSLLKFSGNALRSLALSVSAFLRSNSKICTASDLVFFKNEQNPEVRFHRREFSVYWLPIDFYEEARFL